MAWEGPWGCFIHIPKTSGMWTKRVLRQLGNGKRSRHTHQLPLTWSHERYFTIVREPADWLRSVFCNRRNSRWQDHGEDCPWRDLIRIMKPYRTKVFEEFIVSLVTKEPGIVGWFYDCHTPPRVDVIRFGNDQREYLKKLGCDPEKEAPANVSGLKPEITDELRFAIFHAEYDTYLRYGWTMMGDDSAYEERRKKRWIVTLTNEKEK
jgi:hypothetical protein